MQRALDYPQTRTENVKDTLWGIEVADPYRWLEDDRSEETMAWVDEQIEFTQGYLSKLAWRQPLRDRFEALYNYEKIGMPRKIGNRYFLSKNDGLQNQSVWYVANTGRRGQALPRSEYGERGRYHYRILGSGATTTATSP